MMSSWSRFAIGLLIPLALACSSQQAWKLPPPAAQEAPVVRPGQLHRVTLDNGLQLIVLEDRRLPKVSIGISARRGAGIEAPGEAGLAVYTAELMKRGAGDRDAQTLAQAVDEIGASLTVGAGWDAMHVSVSGLSRNRERLIEILVDVALRPQLDPQEGARARAEQLAGLRQSQDDPATLVRWYAARALYPAHRYGLPQQGSPETVTELDAARAGGFHGKVFVPNNCILYASGDLNAQEFIATASRLLGSASWPQQDVPGVADAPPSVTPTARRVVVVDRPDLVQTRIMILHDGIRRTDDRRLAASLMNNVLGGSGFSSRLMARVRSDEGLTYSVYSGFSLRRNPGPFQISTFTRVAETRRAIDLLLEELEAMIESRGITADELAHAKSYSAGRFGLSLETSDAVVSSLVDLDVQGLPDDSLDTFRARVRAIDRAAVRKAARDLLHPERAAIIVLGPAETLVPALESLGPVEVIEP